MSLSRNKKADEANLNPTNQLPLFYNDQIALEDGLELNEDVVVCAVKSDNKYKIRAYSKEAFAQLKECPFSRVNEYYPITNPSNHPGLFTETTLQKETVGADGKTVTTDFKAKVLTGDEDAYSAEQLKSMGIELNAANCKPFPTAARIENNSREDLSRDLATEMLRQERSHASQQRYAHHRARERADRNIFAAEMASPRMQRVNEFMRNLSNAPAAQAHRPRHTPVATSPAPHNYDSYARQRRLLIAQIENILLKHQLEMILKARFAAPRFSAPAAYSFAPMVISFNIPVVAIYQAPVAFNYRGLGLFNARNVGAFEPAMPAFNLRVR